VDDHVIHLSRFILTPLLFVYRVPLGFVCGFPLQGGELYGGSMFARSAASDTLQGKAIQRVNEQWGDDVLARSGRESLPIPVCKKKYAPFRFRVEKKQDGTYQVHVERMFACKCHHEQRKQLIEQHGLRPGWEPFGQWSLRKAQEMARRETVRINNGGSLQEFSSDEDDSSDGTLSSCSSSNPSICLNGNCTWKVKSAYDNIYKEIHGHTESEAEDNNNE